MNQITRRSFCKSGFLASIGILAIFVCDGMRAELEKKPQTSNKICEKQQKVIEAQCEQIAHLLKSEAVAWRWFDFFDFIDKECSTLASEAWRLRRQAYGLTHKEAQVALAVETYPPCNNYQVYDLTHKRVQEG